MVILLCLSAIYAAGANEVLNVRSLLALSILGWRMMGGVRGDYENTQLSSPPNKSFPSPCWRIIIFLILTILQSPASNARKIYLKTLSSFLFTLIPVVRYYERWPMEKNGNACTRKWLFRSMRNLRCEVQYSNSLEPGWGLQRHPFFSRHSPRAISRMKNRNNTCNCKLI